jgi:Zn-dependent protease/CBS domain-containing protein
MDSGFSIGKIFGINIQIDWSWLFIALLITWNLSAAFGQLHPNWSIALRWSTALAAALLFFISVLAHEMAHSLMARAHGMPVRKITFFLFGGVSNIQRHPPSPSAEFLLTIVGPITSILLGIIFTLIAGISAAPALGVAMTNPSEVAAQLSPLTTLLLWLGPINILLGVFNLIPGFPLDGGRIVRSIFWAISDDLRRATRWASWLGQAVAWLLIASGIAMIFGARIPLFGQGFVNGLWLAFIGWFLNNASVQSYQQLVVHDILEDVPVTRLMRRDPPTVPPTCSITDLVHEHVMGTDDHAFPVVEEGQLVGLVTLEDMRKLSRDRWDATSTREIMTHADDLIVITPHEDAAEALNRLRQRDVRQLPVLRNGTLAGLLRRRDIIRWLQLEAEAETGSTSFNRRPYQQSA